MRNAEGPGFYFALPRLFVENKTPTEGSWIEASIVGALVHLIAWLYAFQILLGDSTVTKQLLLAVPLAFLVWVCWLLVLYLNSFIVQILRALGLMRTTPDRYAQSLLICIMITLFAWRLIAAGSWRQWIGLLWIAAVALNLLAALFLACRDGVQSTTD